MPTLSELTIEPNAAIPTWFGVGGGADRLARPETIDDLRRCLELDRNLRILGDGANLLVCDAGVPELVITMAGRGGGGDFARVDINDTTGHIYAGAGANLPKLITETVRRGLGGLEGLGGIPASIGGAVVMNAGGTFAQFCDVVMKVHALDRDGVPITFTRNTVNFGYRHSGLPPLIVTGVELKLKKDDPAKLRTKLREVMDFKKKSQPLAENSAGCVFKNPTLKQAIPHIGPAGARVSAGMLIDKAGCKGMTVGGATVSDRHANFFTASRACTATDIITLIDNVRDKVLQTFGVPLETEVVIWRRTP